MRRVRPARQAIRGNQELKSEYRRPYVYWIAPKISTHKATKTTLTHAGYIILVIEAGSQLEDRCGRELGLGKKNQ